MHIIHTSTLVTVLAVRVGEHNFNVIVVVVVIIIIIMRVVTMMTVIHRILKCAVFLRTITDF